MFEQVSRLAVHLEGVGRIQAVQVEQIHAQNVVTMTTSRQHPGWHPRSPTRRLEQIEDPHPVDLDTATRPCPRATQRPTGRHVQLLIVVVIFVCV